MGITLGLIFFCLTFSCAVDWIDEHHEDKK